MQQTIPMKMAFSLGVGDNGAPPSSVSLEQGYVDSCNRSYHDRTVTFTGRGTASIFQDIQITAPVLKNAAGSTIISKMFADQNIPLTVLAASPQYAGKTQDQETFDQTMRGRSQWDVMQAIALDDGFRLTCHNGAGTYGPYGQGDPTVSYEWGRAKNGGGLVELDIKHSPRRSHNIKVIARSYLPKSHRSISEPYGVTSAKDGETFQVAARPGLSSMQLKQYAQAVYKDIAKREFLVTATVVPDAAFVQTVAQNGANFKLKLGGPDLWPSQASPIYEIRQVRFEFSASKRGGMPLLAHILAGNVNPINEGGFLS